VAETAANLRHAFLGNNPFPPAGEKKYEAGKILFRKSNEVACIAEYNSQ